MRDARSTTISRLASADLALDGQLVTFVGEALGAPGEDSVGHDVGADAVLVPGLGVHHGRHDSRAGESHRELRGLPGQGHDAARDGRLSRCRRGQPGRHRRDRLRGGGRGHRRRAGRAGHKETGCGWAWRAWRWALWCSGWAHFSRGGLRERKDRRRATVLGPREGARLGLGPPAGQTTRSGGTSTRRRPSSPRRTALFEPTFADLSASMPAEASRAAARPGRGRGGVRRGGPRHTARPGISARVLLLGHLSRRARHLPGERRRPAGLRGRLGRAAPARRARQGAH